MFAFTVPPIVASFVHYTEEIPETQSSVENSASIGASTEPSLPPVTFATNNLMPESSDATEAFQFLNELLGESSQYYRRVAPEDADLVLEVDDMFVRLKRQDTRLGSLDTPSPKLNIHHIKQIIPGLMIKVARFNHFLSLENEEQPFSPSVELGIHVLEAPESYDDYPRMKAGKSIPFDEGEALIPHENDSQLYALVLHSAASQPLYPYVLLFDPSTYGIDIFTQPMDARNPSLKPNGDVQLGRSHECADALWFDLGEDSQKDTGYVKVILAANGNLDFSFITQSPALGSNLDNIKNGEEWAMNLIDTFLPPFTGKSFLLYLAIQRFHQLFLQVRGMQSQER